MISSMTGFGSAEFVDDKKSVSVEIRSVNNRFLKMKIKSPQFLRNYEHEFENEIKRNISRGSVSLVVNYQTIKTPTACNINIENLKTYFKMMQKAKCEIGFENEIDIAALMNMPGVVEHVEKEEEDSDSVKNLIFDLISTSIDEMQKMRSKSGVDIEEEIESRGKQILVLLEDVKAKVPVMLENYTERLKDRISNLLKDTDVTITRDDLSREIAIFADRSDITEEIKLLSSHVSQFKETMSTGGQVGKKLEFIVQEMFREANTMGSKSNDDTMLRIIFDIKTEIEKIKEMVLNIE